MASAVLPDLGVSFTQLLLVRPSQAQGSGQQYLFSSHPSCSQGLVLAPPAPSASQLFSPRKGGG